MQDDVHVDPAASFYWIHQDFSCTTERSLGPQEGSDEQSAVQEHCLKIKYKNNSFDLASVVRNKMKIIESVNI